MNTRPLTTRVEVTDPTGRHFVTDMSLEVAQYTYAPYLGYVVRPVDGYPVPEGFCIVRRGGMAPTLPRTPSDGVGGVTA